MLDVSELDTGSPVIPARDTWDTVRYMVAVWDWSVFPCTGKVPATRHGFKDATQHADTLAGWFDRPDPPNIGVDCGRSRIAVIDVDDYTTFATLLSLGFRLPATLTSLTGGGGVHYIYEAPDWPLSNTASRLPGVDQELPGIDLRATGGYIVAPPSVHPDTGDRYEFMPKEWVDEPAPCPPWLRPREKARRLVAAVSGLKRRARWAEAAVRSIVREVAATREGSRNHDLNQASWRVGRLVGAGLLDRNLVESLLLAAALDSGLDEREAEATIRSGFAAGVLDPWQPS